MNAQLLDDTLYLVGRSRQPATEPANWQANAMIAYHRAEQEDVVALSAELSTRIVALTGRLVSPLAIVVDRDRRRATVVVDGVRFRLQHDELTVVRPCAHCGTGAFDSPAIETVADLGYALGTWAPRHPECQAEDPAEW